MSSRRPKPYPHEEIVPTRSSVIVVRRMARLIDRETEWKAKRAGVAVSDVLTTPGELAAWLRKVADRMEQALDEFDKS